MGTSKTLSISDEVLKELLTNGVHTYIITGGLPLDARVIGSSRNDGKTNYRVEADKWEEDKEWLVPNIRRLVPPGRGRQRDGV